MTATISRIGKAIKSITNQRIPFFTSKVPAGFPSPAEDYIESTLDFNEYLIKNRASTFCMRVHGDSMINAGIFDNDILVVDRSIPPQSDHIIIAILNGEFTVKRLYKNHQYATLVPENPRYQPIRISPNDDFNVWGVVTNIIHRV